MRKVILCMKLLTKDWNFLNHNYWNLDSDALNPFVDFIISLFDEKYINTSFPNAIKDYNNVYFTPD